MKTAEQVAKSLLDIKPYPHKGSMLSEARYHQWVTCVKGIADALELVTIGFNKEKFYEQCEYKS